MDTATVAPAPVAYDPNELIRTASDDQLASWEARYGMRSAAEDRGAFALWLGVIAERAVRRQEREGCDGCGDTGEIDVAVEPCDLDVWPSGWREDFCGCAIGKAAASRAEDLASCHV